jgi:hypothetical protein
LERKNKAFLCNKSNNWFFFYKVLELFIFTVTNRCKKLLLPCLFKDGKNGLNVASDNVMIQLFVNKILTFVKRNSIFVSAFLFFCHQGARTQRITRFFSSPDSPVSPSPFHRIFSLWFKNKLCLIF